jgi:hypothetical protein
MISKNAAAFVKTQSAKASQLSALTQASQRKFSGGGVKKPAMPHAQTDFDIVLVGKKILFNLKAHSLPHVIFNRWHQCYCLDQVLAS